MFTTALFIIAKTYKQPKHPSTDEWIKMWYVCTIYIFHCVYVCIYVCMCVYIYRMYIFHCVYVCIYIYVYMCVYVYIYIYSIVCNTHRQ